MRARHLRHHIQRLERPFVVEQPLNLAAAACAVRRFILPCVLARQEPGSQRTVWDHPHVLVRTHRLQIALVLAAMQQVVVGLQALEAHISPHITDPQRLHQQPPREVAHPDIAYLAGLHQRVQRG